MTDRELEERLRAWYRAQVGENEAAPLSLRRDVAAIPRTSSRRARWFGPGRGVILFAAAALLLIGGAVAAGSGLLRLPSLVPPEPVPSLAVVATPSPAEESPSPTISPSPAPSPSSSVAQPRAASWTATGSMTTPRQQQAATLLPDGKVLVVGGYHSIVPSSYTTADVYDPSSGTWTVTGRMTEDRLAGLTATLLRDGKVLVAGGQRGWTPSAGDGTFASAELYDPATGTWTATGSMSTPRMGHTATLLPNGKVLVAGGGHYPVGDVAGGTLASAELYDPGTGTWTATGSMITSGAGGPATLLRDGKVLVVGGGSTGRSAELYDPATGTWTATGSMVTPGAGGPATLLRDGKVLVVGSYGGGHLLGSAELYDPATGNWTATGSPTTPRMGQTATLLPDGTVLVAGGAIEVSPTGDTILASAELYDPASGTWTATAGMATVREFSTATLLPGGTVLMAGGKGGAYSQPPHEPLASAELYDPGSP